MVRTVCLDEDKHAVTMLRGLKQMRHEDDFCDFTIIVKGIEIPVHRNIIAVASPYFKAMLKHDTIESQQRKVEMKNVDAECVKQCIDFMYSGKFDIPDGKIAKLLHVAIMMQLDNIKDAVCNILVKELKAENFYETKSIAESFNFLTLTAKCEAYYKKNLVAISAQPGFQVEAKFHVIDIFPELSLIEDDQLVVALRWAGNDATRKEDLVDFIKHINLSRVSMRCLSDILKNYPVINDDLHLYKLLNAPLVEYVETNATEGVRSCGDRSFILFDRSNDCLQSYDPTTNEVEKLRDSGFNNFRHFTAIFMHPYIYVLCEDRSVHRLNLDDETKNWEQMPNMIVDHGMYPLSVSFSGSLFVIGYGNLLHATNDVEIFNPIAKQWLKLADTPTPMCRAALVALDESIYCIGGWDGQHSLNSFCKFTPHNSKWTDLPPMRTPRRSCGVAAAGKKIYIIAGYRDRSEPIQDVDCYNGISQQWTSLAPALGDLGFNRARFFGGSLFSFPFRGYSDKIQKYDIKNNSWSLIKLNVVNPFPIYESVSSHGS